MSGYFTDDDGHGDSLAGSDVYPGWDVSGGYGQPAEPGPDAYEPPDPADPYYGDGSGYDPFSVAGIEGMVDDGLAERGFDSSTFEDEHEFYDPNVGELEEVFGAQDRLAAQQALAEFQNNLPADIANAANLNTRPGGLEEAEIHAREGVVGQLAENRVQAAVDALVAQGYSEAAAYEALSPHYDEVLRDAVTDARGMKGLQDALGIVGGQRPGDAARAINAYGRMGGGYR